MSDPGTKTTKQRCERCGSMEPELHKVGVKFVCPACSQTTAGLPPDPLGVWFDSIPASIKRKLSLDDLMRLWRLANEAIGAKS